MPQKLIFLIALALDITSGTWAQGSSVSVANGGAGVAASAGSPFTAFANPAGLVRFDEAEYMVGVVMVENDVTFEGSSFQIIGPRVAGSSTSNAQDSRPSLFFVKPIAERWSLGFGFHAPGSRNLFYDGIMRFLTVREEGNIYNFGPAFAYKVNDKLSLGAALNVQYMEFWCNMFLPEFDENLVPTDVEGFLTTYADDWDVGYTASLLYQFTPETRVGLTYVSKITHWLTGPSTYASDRTPFRSNDDYTLEFRIPAVALLSAHHDLNERWSVMVTVDHTFWDWDVITLSNLVAPSPFTALGGPGGGNVFFQETWGYSAGAELRANDRWTVTAGYRDEEGPTTDEFRGAKDYPAGSTSIGLGVENHISERASIGVAYRYVSGKDAHITGPGAFGVGTQTGEFGVVRWHEHQLGLTLRVRAGSAD